MRSLPDQGRGADGGLAPLPPGARPLSDVRGAGVRPALEALRSLPRMWSGDRAGAAGADAELTRSSGSPSAGIRQPGRGCGDENNSRAGRRKTRKGQRIFKKRSDTEPPLAAGVLLPEPALVPPDENLVSMDLHLPRPPIMQRDLPDRGKYDPRRPEGVPGGQTNAGLENEELDLDPDTASSTRVVRKQHMNARVGHTDVAIIEIHRPSFSGLGVVPPDGRASLLRAGDFEVIGEAVTTTGLGEIHGNDVSSDTADPTRQILDGQGMDERFTEEREPRIDGDGRQNFGRGNRSRCGPDLHAA